jgi:hypothetical protein
MKKLCQRGSFIVLSAIVAAVVATTLMNTGAKAREGAANDAKSAGGPHYTVIETQGFNLLVTDNTTNTLYYYATDKDVPVGSPLKLRASLNLRQVGQKQINLKPHNLENIRKRDDK